MTKTESTTTHPWESLVDSIAVQLIDNEGHPIDGDTRSQTGKLWWQQHNMHIIRNESGEPVLSFFCDSKPQAWLTFEQWERDVNSQVDRGRLEAGVKPHWADSDCDLFWKRLSAAKSDPYLARKDLRAFHQIYASESATSTLLHLSGMLEGMRLSPDIRHNANRIAHQFYGHLSRLSGDWFQHSSADKYDLEQFNHSKPEFEFRIPDPQPESPYHMDDLLPIHKVVQKRFPRRKMMLYGNDWTELAWVWVQATGRASTVMTASSPYKDAREAIEGDRFMEYEFRMNGNIMAEFDGAALGDDIYAQHWSVNS